MNTERELIELCEKITGITIHDAEVRDGSNRVFRAFKAGYEEALKNNPEAEPVAWMNKSASVMTTGQRERIVEGGKYGGEFSVFAEIAKRHDTPLYTAPPSTAALQKRIEELEAQIVNPNGSVLSPLEECQFALAHTEQYIKDLQSEKASARNATLDEAAFMLEQQISWSDDSDEATEQINNFLQTAANQIRALKAGDVQAPKEGWKPIETAPKDGTYLILYGNSYYPHGIMPKREDLIGIVTEGQWLANAWQIGGRTIEATHWQPMPAAPTDTEGK